jgi:uncharacterized protein YecE (DUF72 family)
LHYRKVVVLTAPKLESSGPFIGTAGWGIPAACADRFATEGSALTKYSALLNAAEINSTFYRRHRASTFERWRNSVPESFRFAVKLPRAITHEAELASPREALQEFFDDVRPLGAKLGPVLVQLSANAAFDARRARAFFRALRSLHAGPVACEPRHCGWYTVVASRVLVDFEIARVVADPPRPTEALQFGGASKLRYFRWHGSPHIYRSAYSGERLSLLVERMRAEAPNVTVWCIFDNTASGAATGNAILTQELLAANPSKGA